MRKLAAKRKDLILAIDQGTTGTTLVVLDKKLNVLKRVDQDFPQHFPKAGWVEHDLDEIWATLLSLTSQVRKYAGRIAAIGITNQRETTCFWSKKTGKSLSRALVWQDRRTSALCSKWKKQGLEPFFTKKTGLLVDPYFSASKIVWALENRKKVKDANRKADLAFGTIDSFLIHKLTAGKSHVTDVSNASRTLLMSLQTLEWDADILKRLKISKSILPQIQDSDSCFGYTKSLKHLPDGIPIHGVLGDQQAALFGQKCFDEGMAKCTYGTGSFILLNTGAKIRRSKHRLLSTVAWKVKGKTTYALEGGAFSAGASVQWLRDGLRMIEKYKDVQALAESVEDSGEVVFVPAFVGLGSPHWKPEARAAFFGISRGTTQAHMARAVLEGIALMNHDIFRAMEKDLGKKLKIVHVDGGASENGLLMRLQAEILRTKLVRPANVETTSLGAAFVAGLGVGLWSDLKTIAKSWKADQVFLPTKKFEKIHRKKLLENWNSALKKL